MPSQSRLCSVSCSSSAQSRTSFLEATCQWHNPFLTPVTVQLVHPQPGPSSTAETSNVRILLLGGESYLEGLSGRGPTYYSSCNWEHQPHLDSSFGLWACLADDNLIFFLISNMLNIQTSNCCHLFFLSHLLTVSNSTYLSFRHFTTSPGILYQLSRYA